MLSHEMLQTESIGGFKKGRETLMDRSNMTDFGK